jgi:hypothetical protein
VSTGFRVTVGPMHVCERIRTPCIKSVSALRITGISISRLIIIHRSSALSAAPGQLSRLDLSFAAVAAPASWGSFVPPTLTHLEAVGFMTRGLHMLLQGLASAPRLSTLNLRGSGTFPSVAHVNPYACLRRLTGSSHELTLKHTEEGGCRKLQMLSLGNCRCADGCLNNKRSRTLPSFATQFYNPRPRDPTTNNHTAQYTQYTHTHTHFLSLFLSFSLSHSLTHSLSPHARPLQTPTL